MIRLAAVLALMAAVVAPAADASAARRVAPYDFNRDGRQDIAIGLPRYQPAGAPDAGAVVILPGGRHGPSAHRQLISRRTAGVPGVPTGDDGFGHSLASADFDGDRYADLAANSRRRIAR